VEIDLRSHNREALVAHPMYLLLEFLEGRALMQALPRRLFERLRVVSGCL